MIVDRFLNVNIYGIDVKCIMIFFFVFSQVLFLFKFGYMGEMGKLIVYFQIKDWKGWFRV